MVTSNWNMITIRLGYNDMKLEYGDIGLKYVDICLAQSPHSVFISFNTPKYSNV